MLMFMVLLGTVYSALMYIFYVEGVGKGVELSIAGVVASVELVGSAIIGWSIIGEDFSMIK